MGKTNLGRVSVAPRGAYNNETSYKRLDVVEYEGSSYLFLKDSTGIIPTADGEVTMLLAKRGKDFAYEDFTPEQLAALKGADGNDGVNGSDGTKGDKGEPGKGFTILGYYGTLDLLKAAVPTPEPGDAYGIGTAAPYDIYVFDGVTNDWVDNGKLSGGGASSEANIVLIPIGIIELSNTSTSDQIKDVFGGKENFDSIVNKVRQGNAVAAMAGYMGDSPGTTSCMVSVDRYTDPANLELFISLQIGSETGTVSIKVENGFFSCSVDASMFLMATDLISDPSTGGTDKPASAEAVKKVNDSMLTIDTEQDIVGMKNYEQGVLRMKARLGGWANGLNLISNDKLNHICQFGFYGVNDNLNYAYISREFDNPWVKVLPSGMLNVQNGMKTQNICIESSSDGATNATYGSEINNFNSHLYLQHKTSNNLMMCAGGGKVGIGNVTPQAMLHVEGDIMSSGFNGEGLTVIGSEATITRIKGQMPMALDAPVARYEVQWYNDYARFDVHRGGSLDIAKFSWKYNDTELANMLMNGNINTIGSVHAVGGFWKDSDARIKTDITPLRHTIEQILSIPTDSFLMNGKEQIGTIAQEVEKVCPEVVSEFLILKSEVPKCDDWEIVTENDKEYVKVKRVEYEMLGVLALEGVKLLKAEIEDLKDELKRLKNE